MNQLASFTQKLDFIISAGLWMFVMYIIATDSGHNIALWVGMAVVSTALAVANPAERFNKFLRQKMFRKEA